MKSTIHEGHTKPHEEASCFVTLRVISWIVHCHRNKELQNNPLPDFQSSVTTSGRYRSRFCNKKETRTDRLDARSWFSSLDSELFAHTSPVGRRFGQAHWHRHATTLAHDFDVHSFAHLMFVQRAVQIVV